MCSPGELSTFKILCNHHSHLVREVFHPCSQETLYPGDNQSPSPSPWQLAIYFSVSVNLLITNISYKWNHTSSSRLWLASFTWHDVFKVHPGCSRCQPFIPGYDRIIFHCMERLHVTYTFITHRWWNLGCFHFLAIVNNATTFMSKYSLCAGSQFSWGVSRRGIARSCGIAALNLLRKGWTVIHSEHTTLCSHQQHMRDPISPRSQQYQLFAGFCFK